jgi:hypothetical protein
VEEVNDVGKVQEGCFWKRRELRIIEEVGV